MKNHFYIRDFVRIQENTGLSDKSLATLAETKSENTIDAYESDWNDFCDWCRYHHQSSFPATSETIINYINDLADYAKVSTIRRRISAISENFNAAGYTEDNPCHAWLVREALIGLHRMKGIMQKGKTPIYWEELEKMISLIDDTSLVGARDKAILLLGFLGAFRRSELAGLDVENLSFFPQGMIVTLFHSKTDQEKAGQSVGIPYIKEENMCAVRAIKHWMNISKITSGPLFRGMLKNQKVAARRINDKTINLIVKKYVSAIGLPVDLYGAHSLRHGFATYAALNGIEERLIMKQTRHKSVEMVRHYINEASVFTNNPISMIFDKKK